MIDEARKNLLHERMAALLEDRLSPEGEAELRDLLDSSPEARAVYHQYFELHADLALRSSEPRSVETPPSPRVSRWPLRVAVAALLLVGIWAGWQGGVNQPTPLGRIVAVEGRASDHFSIGPLHAGELSTPREGRLRLEMASGAKVTLPAGGRIEVVDPKMIRLLEGRVTVDVPERAIGFRVVTASADVVDLGTEFGVSIDETGSTEVHVFRGVVVTRSFGGSRVVPLVANEAGVLDAFSGDIQPIPVNAAHFGIADLPERLPAAPAAAGERLPSGSRVVFLGDNMTSRGTHLMILNQALRALPEAEVPRLFNAAIVFPLYFSDPEFERYVRAYRPTHAVLEFGPDIATAADPRTPESFGDALIRLLDRLRSEGIEPILTTGYPTSERKEFGQGRLDQYNARIRELAAERNLRFVDVDRLYRADGEGGRSLLLPKGNLPTFEGFRLLAGGLLGAMGYEDLEVPTSVDPRPLPGIVREWRYRHKSRTDLLTEATVGDVAPGGSWNSLVLPMEDRYSRRLPDPSHAWSFQQARQGFALGLHRREQIVEAVAEVRAAEGRSAVINIGGGVRSVWLNGVRVYAKEQYTGPFPGNERFPVELRAGLNRIVLEARSNFFCSLTDTVDWALPR